SQCPEADQNRDSVESRNFKPPNFTNGMLRRVSSTSSGPLWWEARNRMACDLSSQCPQADQNRDSLEAAATRARGTRSRLGSAGTQETSSRRTSRMECCAESVPPRAGRCPLLLKPQWMNGLSERLLVSHYVNNYGGAVRRLNAIRARLSALDWARTPGFEINGLKREELTAAGSVILHEIYFDSLARGVDESGAYRVADDREHDRNRAGRLQQRPHGRGAIR